MNSILSVVNTKGGGGKTTTSFFLAAVLSKENKVLLVDTDPQGICSSWVERIEETTPNRLKFDFVIGNASSIKKLKKLNYDYIIVDTPPGITTIVQEAINVANLVIIPSPARPADLERTWETYKVALDNKKTAAILITQVFQDRQLYKATRAYIDANEISSFESIIKNREDINKNFGSLPDTFFGYEEVAEEIKSFISKSKDINSTFNSIPIETKPEIAHKMLQVPVSVNFYKKVKIYATNHELSLRELVIEALTEKIG